MKTLFAALLLSSLLLPSGAALAAPGDTNDVCTATDTCTAQGAVCTGGFCVLESTLPPGGFRLGTDSEVPQSGADILSRISLIANWVFAIFLAISLIYILLGAFQFVTAGADPARISQAREKLIYAMVGIAIALLAAGFPAIIRTIVT
ncbi:MAG: hypothetical protein Q8P12_03740 [bacterium]|nr:hypothetical protein [bacterium]